MLQELVSKLEAFLCENRQWSLILGLAYADDGEVSVNRAEYDP